MKLQEISGRDESCWIGLNVDQVGNETYFSWIDGYGGDYFNINSNNGSNSSMNADCGAITTNSSAWILYNCEKQLQCWVCNNLNPTTAPTGAPSVTTTLTTLTTTAARMTTKNEITTTIRTITTMASTLEEGNGNEDDAIVYSILGVSFTSVTFTFTIIMVCFIFVSVLVIGLAYNHMIRSNNYDDVKFLSLVIFGFQVFDFYSDVNFSLFLSDKENNSNVFLFVASVIFIILPWTYNVVKFFCFVCSLSVAALLVYIVLCFCKMIEQVFLFYLATINWLDNVQASSWIRIHRKKLVIACMLSGGIYHSVKLMNCRLFGMSMLDMGLSHRQLLFIAQRTVIVNVIFENLPQIGIQIAYLTFADSILDIAVILALISSVISFASGLISAVLNMLDDLNGMYFKQKYNPLNRCRPHMQFGNHIYYPHFFLV